ncbi:uncharacterized protein BDFB_012691, partial [Asbolus verrucosus]
NFYISPKSLRIHALNLYSLAEPLLDQNFFQFNNNYYVQKTGFAMGSNLSPLMAEIFMNSLERKIQSSAMFSKHILFWIRYVGDILTLFKGTKDDLNQFLSFLNFLHPSIKFTFEIENNNSIPFLDILVSHKNHQFFFDVYRKPSATDTVIPYKSCHPNSHKFASFYALFHRFFSIPLSDDGFDIELKTIFQIAKNNQTPFRYHKNPVFINFNVQIVMPYISARQGDDYKLECVNIMD